ncbi:IclR family transcriptional regulator domain-containing protein [Streptomyces mangrovisoli]|uniref:Glycerol operon regulatory protein n=1 Tax=Streptomyces mangrovisoli TaxID=1428628 RepID=A0A1J4NQ22_9ACTN|nr:IclR family transcriptional regulator C-terminal domain-containing protein [Streptomyces mangrovisoli]OIJ64471.1 IclR family transcriptional regulator [Streptomyces mangrovisoli]
MTDAVREPHFVRSLERGLAVIRTLGAARRDLTLSQVAYSCGLTRAAARRFLLTLTDLGYVRTDGRAFRLTPRVLELGHGYLSGLTLPGIAAPHLVALAETAGEPAFLCVLDGADVVHVARVPARRLMAADVAVGSRFPAADTAAGRMLLAHAPGAATAPEPLRADLIRLRGRGFAVVDGELEPGMRGVAAPVRDRGGEVVAAVTVLAHAGRVSRAAVRRDVLPALREAVARIEADLAPAGAAGAACAGPTGPGAPGGFAPTAPTDPGPGAAPGTGTRR